MLNTDIKIKSEALVNELDTYVLGLKKTLLLAIILIIG
jgi:hypothetical protein